MNAAEESHVIVAFGAAIRATRSRLGVSQEALADLSELDRTYVSGVERGVRNPTVKSIWRLATALKVLPSDLFLEAERELESRGGRLCPTR